MRRFWLLLTVALLLTSLVTALADVQPGSFYEYRYSLSAGERSAEGKVRVAVVNAVGEGSIRLRLEATFNDGLLTFEKNVPSSAFAVPTLRLPESGSFSYTKDGHHLSVSVVRTGTGSRAVGGRTYETELYSLRVVAESRNASLTVVGTVELISGSGAIYAVDLTATGGGSGGARFTAQLVDTNLDLTRVVSTGQAGDVTALASLTPSLLAPGSSDLSRWIGAMGLPSGQQPPSPTNAQGTQGTKGSPKAAFEDPTTRVIAITAIGLATIGSVESLGLLRRPRRSYAAVSKPHYV